MAKTIALIELETRIREIESTLLPPINPLGIYSNAEQDSIRAFVLLCHAENDADRKLSGHRLHNRKNVC